MDNLEAIKLTVEAGYGVTIAPAFAVSREVSSGSLAAVPLSDASAQLSVFCVYHADRRLSQLATTFIELLAVNATDEPGPAGASRDDSHYPAPSHYIRSMRRGDPQWPENSSTADWLPRSSK